MTDVIFNMLLIAIAMILTAIGYIIELKEDLKDDIN